MCCARSRIPCSPQVRAYPANASPQRLISISASDETNAAWQTNARFWCDGRASSVNRDTRKDRALIGTLARLEKPDAVLREVSAGRANKQVAASLHLSEETVKTHMRSILAKLNAQDRTHVVMIALRRQGF